MEATSGNGAGDITTAETSAVGTADVKRTLPRATNGDAAGALSRSRPTPISTKLHGVLDYLTGAQLVAAPSALGIDGPAAAALRAAGAGHAGYSLFTRYELGVVKVLPMRAHLVLDALGAVGLAASPFLLGTHRQGVRHWLPHVLFGVYELAAVALSDPGDD